MAVVYSTRALFGAAGIAACDLRGAIHIRGPVMAGGGKFCAAKTRCILFAMVRVEVAAGIADVALAVLVVIFDFFTSLIVGIVNAGCAADGADFVRSPAVVGAFGEAKIEAAILSICTFAIFPFM